MQISMNPAELGLESSAVPSEPAVMRDEVHVGQSSEPASLSTADVSRPVVEMDALVDGRTTPTPESESANFLSRNASFQSQSAPATTPETHDDSGPLQPALDRQSANTILAPKAEVGFGSLSGEDQLKASLKTKDRLFLLVLAKEVEAFLTKVQSGDMPNVIPSVPLATTSTSVLASMTASFIMGSKAGSTFQRMLVYKLADWYGVKAVHTPEVGMLIGVIGTCDPNRLADLAPRADSPPPKIKLMRRNQGSTSVNGSSRPGSAITSAASSETGSNRAQTLEEREEAYAKARERIYGPEGEAPAPLAAPPQSAPGGRQGQVADVEFETAPRNLTVRQSAGLYASLNDPMVGNPGGSPSNTMMGSGNTNGRTQAYNPHFQYQQPLPQPQQQQGPIPYPPYGMAAQTQMGPYPSQNYGYPPFNPMMNGNYLPGGGMNTMYPNQQPHGYQNQWGQMSAQQVYGPPQMPTINSMPPMHPSPIHGQVWSSPNQLNMQNQHQPMPMIPQGMQPSYGFPNQNGHGYSHLVQPTPMRPPPHPHSSASSSISSMSYHSSNWHDVSRPHSRGSTTSNMSATSSVRFGAMYPANQQGGRYQQKGMKGPGVGGRGGTAVRKNSGSVNDSRSTRPHSPSSAGTTSSQSSRKAGSINLAPPSQHPLPSRPDWAADNIPYHPAPIPQHPYNVNGAPTTGPSSNDFPPLRQHGVAAGSINGQGHGVDTFAEPMQVERAKMRHPSGTVWNGAAASTSPRASVAQPPAPASPVVPSQATPSVQVSLSAPGPTPASAASVEVNPTVSAVGRGASNDPDFPRRATSIHSSQTLYDPSAPTSSSRPESTKPVVAAVVDDVSAPGMIPQEIIEAKLAEMSIREGWDIGLPVPKTHGPPPSYAKIVRRE